MVRGKEESDTFLNRMPERPATQFLQTSVASAPLSGIPTADVTGQAGFCTLERVEERAAGYEFLVRFFIRATGALAVTVRTAEVEQVFCTSEAGGEITVADLTAEDPEFVVASLGEVDEINSAVAAIIR